MKLDELQIMILDPIVAENLRILLAAHVLDFRQGTIEVAYDDTGRIRRVTNHLVSFKV